MTEEKNINVDAEKDKFANKVLTEDELDKVAGGTGGKMYDIFIRDYENQCYSEDGTTGK